MNASGDRVAIGADANDGTANAGHVRIYRIRIRFLVPARRDIDGEAAGDLSGVSVSMNSSAGDRVAIGAINDGTANDAGHVRIYEYASGSWSQLGADIDGEAADDGSGYSVSMNSAGDRVAIGAYKTMAPHPTQVTCASTNTIRFLVPARRDIDGEAAGDFFGIFCLDELGR